MVRPAAIALCAVLAAWCVLPATAAAHAVVEETRPARGAALETAPARVSVTFDEPVESSFGALRVFDSEGERVDVGDVLRPGGDAVAVELADDLPDGPYTATYRVVSADSHPVDGGFVFTVGRSGGVPAVSVADLLADSDAGPVTEIAFGAARAVGYAAIALLAGGAAFVLLAWLPALRRSAEHANAPATVPPDAGRSGAGVSPAGRWTVAAAAFEARAGTLLVAAALAGLAATALGIVLQAATATGGSFWSALDAGLVHDVLNTCFGDVWKLRFTAFGALVPLLLFLPPLGGPVLAGRRPRIGAARAAAIAVALAYLVVSPALGGHAGAGDDSAWLVPLDTVHVAAMSAWVGGVALLTLAVPAATRLLDPADRTRLLAAVVARFSTLALASVAALLASGVAQSVLHLDALANLVDTAFGRAILVKSAIFATLVALGAHNRRRSQPALARLAAEGAAPGRSGLVLRRALRAEVALMVAVLAVTAALVSYSPSAGMASGPFAGSADLGPARLELTVDPARVGRNAVHVYLFDRRTGVQYDAPRALSITASEPERDIGPLALRVRKAGPGHYTVPRADLTPGGDWELTARARISEFEELRAELEVPIR
jgi:copper transport protein